MIGFTKDDDQDQAHDRVVVTGWAGLPRVNLLPPEIALQRRFRRVQAGLAGGVLAAFVVVALLYVVAGGSVRDAQDEVDTTMARQQTLQCETAQYSEVTTTSKRITETKAMLVSAMGEEVRYSRLLSDLSVSIPEGVWLKTATYTAVDGAAAVTAAATAAGTPALAPGLGTLTVTGVAYQHEDVALWLESLAGQPAYTEPLLQTDAAVLIGPKAVLDFSTTVTLSTDALSRRYVTPGS